MAKIFVKNRDNSGIFFVYTQNIGVRRNLPIEVEKDALIVHAIAQGAIVEVTKKEHDKFHEERNGKLTEKQKEKVAASEKKAASLTASFTDPKDPANPSEEDLKAAFDEAVKKDVFKLDGDNYFFGKTKLGKEDDALEEMKDDNGLYQEVLKALA